MLGKLRWFVYGLFAGVGGSAYLVVRVRRLRATLSPANVARAGALSVADLLDAAAHRVDPRRVG